MSFFNRVMASVGIGAAKVDTLLENASCRVGEEIRGIVRVQGGNVEQDIDGIELSVRTRYVREVNDQKSYRTAELGRVSVTGPFKVRPNQTEEFPFSFVLPYQTPLSVGRTPVWIATSADIKAAVDPSDKDWIQVLPHPHMQTVMDAVEQLGFRLKEVETVYAPRIGGALGFVQEFEYLPGGAFRGVLDELELVFLNVRDSGVEVLLQVDRRAGDLFSLFAEAMDLDESFVRVSLGAQDLQQGVSHTANLLQNVISRHS